MGISVSDVTIHINETLDTHQIEVLEVALREVDGVVSVKFPTDKPHLVLVSYFSDQVTSKRILDLATNALVTIRRDGQLSKNKLHLQLAGL